MKLRKILSVLLVAVMLITSLGVFSIGSHAAKDSLDDYAVVVTLKTGVQVGYDDIDEAFEVVGGFGGSKIKLNKDVRSSQPFYIDCELELDLNGHTITGVSLNLDCPEFTVIDSSADGGGQLVDAYLYSMSGAVTVENVGFEGELFLANEADVIFDGVSGENLEICCDSDRAFVKISDAVFNVLVVRCYDELCVVMDGLTVLQEFTLNNVTFDELFDSECVSVTDENGDAVEFTSPDLYVGYLKIEHDNTKIDKNTLKYNNLGHWTECVCGYREGYEKHVKSGEKCATCNASMPLTVTAGGKEAKFFDIQSAIDYAIDNGGGTVKLTDDVVCNESNTIDAYEAVEVVIDLNGYELNLHYVSIYEQIEFTVTDTSASREGALSVVENFYVNDKSVFVIDDVKFSGCINLEDETRAYLSGNFPNLDLVIEGDSTATLKDAEVGFLEINAYDSDTNGIFLVDVTVNKAIYLGGIVFSDILDSSCLTVEVGGGNSLDYETDGYYCAGEPLVITHDNTRMSSNFVGRNGIHGKVCSDCGCIDSPVECSGGAASCTAEATCSTCGEKYGKKLPHVAGDDLKCTSCNTSAIIKLEGDGKTLGFFDVLDAFSAGRNMQSARITLLGDVYSDEESNARGNVTLDLNGFDFYVDELNVRGRLVIDDTSASKNGTFSTDSTIDIYEQAQLIVEKGSFIDDCIYFDLETESSLLEFRGGSYYELCVDFEEAGILIIDGIDAEWLEIDFYTFGIVSLKNAELTFGFSIYDNEGFNAVDKLAAECVTFYNEAGEEVSPVDVEGNDEYLRVVHDDTLNGTAYVGRDGGHYLACTCAAPKNNELLAHKGGTATCEARASCEDCGYAYGKKKAHSFTNGVCTECDGIATLKVEADGYTENVCSIVEAMELAKELGKVKITLLAHLVELVQVWIDGEADITLDLAGYTLAVKVIASSGVNVTVTDSSASKSGALLVQYIYLEKDATLNLLSGNYYCQLDAKTASINVIGGMFRDVCFFNFTEETDFSVYGGVFESGVIIRSYTRGVKAQTIADMLPNTLCYKFCDENSNAVDMTVSVYEGYLTVMNTCSFELKMNKDAHWYACKTCGDSKEAVQHVDEDKSGDCDFCKYDLTEKDDGGLGVGAIVGITVGGVILLGGGGFALFWFVIKKKSLADLLAVFKK